jgi:hypothetical protein
MEPIVHAILALKPFLFNKALLTSRVAPSDIINILAFNEAEREKSNTTFLEIMADLRQQGQQKNNLLERLVVLQESK